MTSEECTLGQAVEIASAIMAGDEKGEGWVANRSFCPYDNGPWDGLDIGAFVIHGDSLYVKYGEWEEYSCGVECCGWASFGLAKVTFK